MLNKPEIESAPPAQGLRDRIRDAIAQDRTLFEFPVTDGGAGFISDGLPEGVIDRCADIAFAVISEQPAAPAPVHDDVSSIHWQLSYMCEEIAAVLGLSTQTPAATVQSVRDAAKLLKERDATASPAAQSRAVVDREKLIRILQNRLLQYNEQLEVQRARDNGSHSSIRNIARLESARSELDFVLRDISRLETLDLSTLGGVDRVAAVKDAWKAYVESRRERNGITDCYFSQTDKHLVQVDKAIAALDLPDASGEDSGRLDWLAEMFDYVDVYRFIKDGEKTHEFWLNRFFNPNIKFPTLREAVDATIATQHSITPTRQGLTDTQRLDWLESQNHTRWWQVNIKGDFGTEITLRSNAANGYRTAREAIDAAMQPDKERAND